MTAAPALAAAWPPFGIRLRTERLELRIPTDDELVELHAAARTGIHLPDEMPFATPWTDGLAEPLSSVAFLAFHWHRRAALRPEAWNLGFGVFLDGRPIGEQGHGAERFAELRTVATGSWLARRHHRRGLGTEMRAAVLELAFVGLGADVALSGALVENVASQRVSERLGYVENGEARLAPRGVARTELRYRLDRERWARHRRHEVAIEGLEPCLALLGVPATGGGS